MKRINLDSLRYDDEKIEIISNHKSVSDETKNRIFKRVQEKCKINHIEMEFADKVEGVDVYKNPKIFRKLVTAACAVMIIGFAAAGGYFTLKNNSVDSQSQIYSEHLSQTEIQTTKKECVVTTIFSDTLSSSMNVQVISESATESANTTMSISTSKITETTETINSTITTCEIKPQTETSTILTLEKPYIKIEQINSEIITDNGIEIPSGAYAVHVSFGEYKDFPTVLITFNTGSSSIIFDSDGNAAVTIGNAFEKDYWHPEIIGKSSNGKTVFTVLALSETRDENLNSNGDLFTFYMTDYFAEVEEYLQYPYYNPFYSLVNNSSNLLDYYEKNVPHIHGDWNNDSKIDMNDAIISALYIFKSKMEGNGSLSFSILKNYIANNSDETFPDANMFSIWNDYRDITVENTVRIILDYVICDKLGIDYIPDSDCIIGTIYEY